MKFLGIALVVLVYVSVAVVEGRKDHKRGKKEHMRWESRREQIGNMRPKMMRISKAQQTAKANVGEVQANNDAAAKQVEYITKRIAKKQHNIPFRKLRRSLLKKVAISLGVFKLANRRNLRW